MKIIKPCYIISFLIIILGATAASADIVETRDGTTVSGKVLQKSKDIVVFANSYGTFYIVREKIVRLIETGSPEEDIKIFRKKGMAVNRKGIVKDYEAGEKKKKELAENNAKELDKSNLDRSSFDYSLTPFGYLGLGAFNDLVSYGYHLSLNMDVEIDDILYGTNKPPIPDFKVDISYYQLGAGSKKVSGPSLLAGPEWSVGVTRFGHVILSPLIGAGYYKARNETREASAIKLTGSVIAGFKYSFSSFTLLPQFRYTYIYDNTISLHSIGFGIGVKF